MPDLLAIGEYPDLYADACCASSDDDCLFLSVWGRDTAIQELLARLTLPPSQNGLDALHIQQDKTERRIRFRDMDCYSKRSTRVFRQTRFGSLVQLWLYDQRCVSPDRANLEAIVLLEREAPEAVDNRLWVRVKDLCPLPLLDPWQGDVMTLLHTQHAILSAGFSLGPLCAWEIKLDEQALATSLSGMIRCGVFTPEP